MSWLPLSTLTLLLPLLVLSEFNEMPSNQGFPVLEIHSRKSQGHRNKVSELFRNGQGLVMFTSDVSARGMDYPDVSAVIQVKVF